jgi:phytanoyl-CoA hydroxylase
MVTSQSWFSKLPWVDQPNADIEGYCKDVKEDYNLLVKLKEWRENGVVIFENAIDFSDIADFQEELDTLISNPMSYSVEIDHLGARSDISQFTESDLRSFDTLKFCNVHGISPAARKLSLSKTVVSFLAHIFGERPCVMQTLTFNKGSQQPAHADFAFVFNQTDISYMAASWIPLEDIHADAGPLAYYPGTHKVGEFGFYDFGDG